MIVYRVKISKNPKQNLIIIPKSKIILFLLFAAAYFYVLNIEGPTLDYTDAQIRLLWNLERWIFSKLGIKFP